MQREGFQSQYKGMERGYALSLHTRVVRCIVEPRAAAAQDRAAEGVEDVSEASEAPGASGATVLLVDDNAELLDLLARSLRHIGHFTVVQAEDGASGLELALTTRPACIVIDVMMPGLDGYQLVRALRGDPASAGIPVVMLTALAQDANQLGGLLAGADRYLVKPVKIQDLIAAITGAIALSDEERLRRRRELTRPDDGDRDEGGGNEDVGDGEDTR